MENHIAIIEKEMKMYKPRVLVNQHCHSIGNIAMKTRFVNNAITEKTLRQEED